MDETFELAVPDGQPVITHHREFGAPVTRLFRAHADPGLMARWVGPKEAGIRLSHFDFRPGGGYAYRQVDGQGRGHVFNGVFHTVLEDELIIQTREFDGVLELIGLESVAFTDLGDGRSGLTGHHVYRSQGARDAMASGGMEKVLVDGFARLDAVLEEMHDGGNGLP